ncbi:fatty acid hydroxylase superfamily-domain-containing protein [Gilbertella persicaria]|uniref:fatty acid hydroxylase superfamily-domain-containing protein n=1 Tax=Gilbertella persicaria TaxID=101096 RepID=UPI00221EC2E1|nr:fatty acid hydroxylase superfamily-domain-containing protein [Gilbertella persicaria]KAI8068117.1 fatty acid hydroxylase superfamily-domain-containing protein [Gilbertella persicaria]
MKNHLNINLASLQDPWSDEMLALWLPIAAYWVYSTFWLIVMKAQLPYFEQYRIHTMGDMEKRNKVSVSRVLSMVTLQHLIQAVLGFLVLKPVDPISYGLAQERQLHWWTGLFMTSVDRVHSIQLARVICWVLVPLFQFVMAMVIMDAHQYFLHRLFHINKFLYKHIHSHHHRLYVPYAFGALYNHPLEGFLLDTCGAAIAVELTRLSPKMTWIFFTFSTLKTVDDHCGYALPWDPLQFLFGNNVQYHDIHHQSFGIKTNFSQPFFTFWDKLLGTEMSLKEAEKRNKQRNA